MILNSTLFRLLLLGVAFLQIFNSHAQKVSADSLDKLYDVAFELSHANQHDSSKALMQQGIELSKAINDSSLTARGYIDLAELYFFSQDLKKAESFAQKSEAYCSGIIDTMVCLKASSVLASVYGQQGRYQKALKGFRKALHLCEEADLTEEYHGVLFNMTSTLVELGMYKEALDNYIKCQEYYEKEENHIYLATIHNNLGLLYMEDLNEYDKAEYQFRKAISLDKKTGQQWSMARNYNNLSLVFIEKEHYDSARYYINEAIEIRQNFDDLAGLANLYSAKAELELITGAYKEARDYYLRAQGIAERFGIAEGRYYTNLGLGLAYDSLGNHDIAEDAYQKATDFARETENLDFQKISAEHLYRHYKMRGKPAQALAALEEADQHEDSINQRQYDREFQELKTRYETEMTEKENELLRAQQEQQSVIMEQDKTLRQVFYIVFVVFLLVLISLIFAYRSRNKAYNLAKRQKKELEKMNQKLRDQSGELNQINASKDRLFSVISHDLRAPLASLDSCLEIMLTEDLSNEEKDELIRDLQKETYNTLKTLDDLLAWARLQQKGEMIEKEEFELNELIQEVINLYRPVAKHKNVEVKFEKETGNSAVSADPNQIRTVTRNLVSNAIKFSPENGTVIIHTRRDNGHFEVSVRDEGKGISPEELKKIKDPDEYYTSRGTGGESGTGVGLMLSFEFIQRHGNELKLEPADPKGTRAYFQLDAANSKSSPKSA